MGEFANIDLKKDKKTGISNLRGWADLQVGADSGEATVHLVPIVDIRFNKPFLIDQL